MKSEEFIREVDEELQREQLAKLWHRYGGLVVGLAVLVVVGTAAKVGWDHWRQQAMAEEALRFHAAEQALTAKPAEAAEQFAALAAQGDTGYAALARLKEAQARITLKDQVAAKKALEELATSGTGDAVLRDLGTLLATAAPGDLARRLEPLAQDDAPWRYRARELLALLAIRTGDLDRARKLLEPLSREVGVPQTQQRRAQELLDAIGGATQQASS